MPKQPKAQPPSQTSASSPPKSPTTEEALVANAYLMQMEGVLHDSLDPDVGGEIHSQALLDMMDATVFVAYRRKYIDEEFHEALKRCTKMHAALAKLEDCTLYKTRLNEAGQETPNIDETQQKLVDEIMAIRRQAMKVLTLSMQCAPEGKAIS